jgi:hypothetical protein
MIFGYLFVANLFSILSVTIWNGDGLLFVANAGLVLAIMFVEDGPESSDDTWNKPHRR